MVICHLCLYILKNKIMSPVNSDYLERIKTKSYLLATMTVLILLRELLLIFETRQNWAHPLHMSDHLM